MKKEFFIIFFIILIIIAFIFYDYKNNKDDSILYEESNKTYEQTIFDDSYVHNIDIIISDDYYNDLQNNPTSKTDYRIDAIIDGVKIKNIGFRTKGNSSLNKVAEGPKTERYSFKINFGKYVTNQTYDGLDKLHLNNIYADATYIKDYMSYYLFRKMNVNAPLTSFANIKINGRDLGLYMLAEDVDTSFLKRYNLKGNLYKPEQDHKDNGSSLIYKSDNIDDYTDIFNNKITDSKNDDYKVLINSLKNINKNNDIEKYTNIDEIIRYFAVHNYLLSYDSYTGPSIHNYYLYEENGKLSLFPWDYNMSYGSFAMENDSNLIVNFGIDSPLYNANEKDRPLWNIIKTNKEYLNKYHTYIYELLNNNFLNNEFDTKIDKTYNLLKESIQNDKTAFYKPNEVEEAIKTFKEFNKLRVSSIKKQLDGSLSTTTSSQKKEERIDTQNINMEKMGMMTSVLEGQQEQQRPQRPERPQR